MSFKDAGWSARFAKMGDEAEGRFELYCEANNLPYVRFGLNRPPISVAALPERIRFAPDYLQSRRFVECQGLGNDQIHKLKIAKHNCLRFWNAIHPVWLYTWDSKNERECFLSIVEYEHLLGAQRAEIRAFPEGHAYFAVKADAIWEAASLIGEAEALAAAA